jgi:uncharacterized repeat protein (TIGR01451 family)
MAGASTEVRAILRLRKIASPATVTAGGRLTYELKVTNPNSLPAAHVSVCDFVPLGLAYIGSNPKARLSKGRQCWAINRLPAYRSETITLLARALPGASGSLINHATASARGIKTVRASDMVHVDPIPKPEAPVTG